MDKFLIVIWFLLILAFFFGNTNDETDNGKAAKKEVVIFSEVKGKVSLKGTPLENIKVTRTYPNSGGTEDITEITYTGADGGFHFNKVNRNLGIMRFLPHEAVIHQTINAEYQGEEYLIWYTCKRNYDNLGEFKFLEEEPKLSPEMSAAYTDGYILLNSDLEHNKELIQSVNYYIMLTSIIDLKLPYEKALKKHARALVSRKSEFTREVSRWFKNNKDFIANDISRWFENNEVFIERFKNGEAPWVEGEMKRLIPYKNVVIEGVDSVNYSDNVRARSFVDDFDKSAKSVSISGEIILNIVNPDGEKLKARIWLSDSIFLVSETHIVLEAQEHHFIVNGSNIDPNVVD